jgi:cell division protein FtsQ
LKRPERELLAKERKRLSRARHTQPRTRSIGLFALWSRIFAVTAPLVLISLVAATFFTPLLAIEKIKVVGTERLDQRQIAKALNSLEGRPLPTVSDSEITELLSEFALIETFAVQAQPPHTLIVKVRERQPLLVLVRAGKNYLYDAAGVQIEQTSAKIDLPFLKLQGQPAKNPRFKVAVDLLLSLPVETYKQVFSVEVSESLTAQLTLKKSNITVIWGSTDQALLKSEVLQSLLSTKLANSVVVDVSSPNAPVVTYPNY